MKLVLGLLVALSLLLAHPLSTVPSAQAATVNKVAAVVNGKVITMFDLQNNAMPELARQHVSASDTKATKEILRKVLDMMIMDILFEQEAKRLKVKISASDVDNEIKRMYKSRRMTEKQFLAQLAREKTTLDSLRADVRRSMIRQKIMSMEVGRRVVVTPQEVEKYYEEHKSTMYNRQGLRMALIVYNPKAPVATIARKVKSGEIPWLEASQKYSILPNRDKGGDNGEIQWGNLNDEWSRRLNNMQPGDVTDLFVVDPKHPQYKGQVRMYRPGNSQEPLRIMTLEEARPVIDGILRNPKAQDRFETYSKQLRDKAVIDIRL